MEIVDSVPDSAKPHITQKVDFYSELYRLHSVHDERWVKEVYSTPNAASSAITRLLKNKVTGYIQVRRDGATVYMRVNPLYPVGGK
jgi:hypothetical protein